MTFRPLQLLSSVLVAVLFAGCASMPEGRKPNPADPWEGFNRNVYAFNDAVDRAVLKPVAQGYQAVVPDPVQTGVSNVFSNLGEPVNAVNNLLQGKFSAFAGDVGRFGINSLLGILGIWDVATPMGLEKSNEDFGQTLGKWGSGPGPFLVLPLLGPSTVRDGIGRIADAPLGYSPYVTNEPLRYSMFVTELVNLRAGLLKAEKVLDDAALDRYSFIRDAYLQRRRNLVYDGKPPKEEE